MNYSHYILENLGNFEFEECLEITIHGENSGVQMTGTLQKLVIQLDRVSFFVLSSTVIFAGKIHVYRMFQ